MASTKVSAPKRGRGRPLTSNSIRMSERIFRLVATNIAKTGKPNYGSVLAQYEGRSNVGTIQAVLNRANFFEAKNPARAAAIRAEVAASVAAPKPARKAKPAVAAAPGAIAA